MATGFDPTGFEPDEPPPATWVALTVWVGGLAFSVALWGLAILGCVHLMGCAK